MPHSNTEEQNEILEFVKTKKENLCIEALAGTGKTHTLCLIVDELIRDGIDPSEIFTLCFARRNREDFEKKMPPGVKFATFNSLGYGAWKQARGCNFPTKQYKTSQAIRSNKIIWEKFPDLSRVISLAKNECYVPADFPVKHRGNSDPAILREILRTYNIDIGKHEESAAIALINQVMLTELYWSFGRPDSKELFPPKWELKKPYINFDDQLYMSALFGGVFHPAKIILVDEAQDLSLIQHRMISLITGPTSRFIMVGDPNQAIYGFRGAHRNSFNLLAQGHNCHRLPLSINFRCAKSVILEAQKITPAIKAWEHSHEGTVNNHGLQWEASQILEGEAILSRYNAPLVSMFYRLIKAGRPAAILGKDLGKRIEKIVIKYLGETGDFQIMEQSIVAWRNTEADKAAAKNQNSKLESIHDTAAVLLTILDRIQETKPTCRHIHEEMLWEIRQLFASEKAPIILSTIHKAKGFEWPSVWILNPRDIPSIYAREPWEKDQEKNLYYVAITRAKGHLNFIEMETRI